MFWVYVYEHASPAQTQPTLFIVPKFSMRVPLWLIWMPRRLSHSSICVSFLFQGLFSLFFLGVCLLVFLGNRVCISFVIFSPSYFIPYKIYSLCICRPNQLIFFFQLGAIWDRWFNKIVIILITCVNGCHIVSLFCHSHTHSQTDKRTLTRTHTCLNFL